MRVVDAARRRRRPTVSNRFTGGRRERTETERERERERRRCVPRPHTAKQNTRADDDAAEHPSPLRRGAEERKRKRKRERERKRDTGRVGRVRKRSRRRSRRSRRRRRRGGRDTARDRRPCPSSRPN